MSDASEDLVGLREEYLSRARAVGRDVGELDAGARERFAQHAARAYGALRRDPPAIIWASSPASAYLAAWLASVKAERVGEAFSGMPAVVRDRLPAAVIDDAERCAALARSIDPGALVSSAVVDLLGNIQLALEEGALEVIDESDVEDALDAFEEVDSLGGRLAGTLDDLGNGPVRARGPESVSSIGTDVFLAAVLGESVDEVAEVVGAWWELTRVSPLLWPFERALIAFEPPTAQHTDPPMLEYRDTFRIDPPAS